MPVPVEYVLCECPEHGTVHAKRTGEYEGDSTEPRYAYECPGVKGDTGGCNGLLTPLGQPGERPDWAEYVSD